MRTGPAVLCWLSLTLLVPDSFAWGGKGHRLIALLAETRLANNHPEVLGRVQQLLGPGVTLADIAVCADEIREYMRPRSRNASVSPVCNVTQEEIARDYPDTAAWHYVNLPVNLPVGADVGNRGATLKRACKGNCITAQIERFTKILRNRKAEPQQRRMALLFLVHLVADLHQPLHAVQRNNDQGGNLVYVKLGRRVMRLHSAWDTYLVDNLSSPKDGPEAPVRETGKPADWAWESYETARDVVYAGVPDTDSSEKNPIVLGGSEYRRAAEAAIHSRIQAAAVRLSDLVVRCLSR